MLSKILNTFEQIMTSHRGEVSCVVTTAKPLDRSTEKELSSALEKFLQPGQKINLFLKVRVLILSMLVIHRISGLTWCIFIAF